MKTELSPAAQAVHDAAFSELPDGLCLKAALAAAFRAVNSQLSYGHVNKLVIAAEDLLAIATELEIQP